MATIKDVAKMAGVSISTVSKYINGGNVRGANLEAIRSAIRALDYRVNPFARSLKMQPHRTVGVLLPELSAPFFSNLLTVMDKILREAGYHTIISCYSANHGMERDNLNYIISSGIDGLVYIPENLSCEEYEELTGKYNVPTVQVDRMIQGVATDAVLVDNADAVYGAVCSLIGKGHQRIAIISGPRSVFTARERQVGYLRALDDHGILYQDDLFITGENIFATGYQGCEALLALPEPPTAIIATNHNITMGFVTALRERGLRFPEDIDVVGFDCVDVCSMMKPPLPVICQPEALIGQTAAEYLIQRLDGCSDPARQTRFPCTLMAE